jgi:hypothetical protein
MKTVKLFDMEFDLRIESDFPNFGHTDYDQRIIRLSEYLTGTDYNHKLIHEIIHVIAMKFNLPVADCGQYDENEVWTETAEQTLNHMQIDLIAYGIADYLARNP